jgi:phosphoribosylamine--glycine ligase
MYTVLVVGSGGREHALAWALARSPQVRHVYVAPGNAGTSWSAMTATQEKPHRAAATNIAIAVNDFANLIDFVREQQIDLTVVGPEAPLAEGIVDAFRDAGLRIFGPDQAAARLESSKTFAKAFMHEHAIPTADYATFTDYQQANQFIAERANKPLVVKADGLAAGKGVIVCADGNAAHEALRRIMVDREFGAAGDQVVIEERLQGREVSVLAFTDGKSLVCMPPARDHKPVYDGDQGPNTGGMGAYTHPADIDDAWLAMVEQTVLRPVVEGMAKKGMLYQGVLYAGLILTDQGPRVLEFNCRFGDPEIEAIIPLVDGDMLSILLACVDGYLDEVDVQVHSGVGATVVLASPGYPGSYPKGLPITGTEQFTVQDDVLVFHAGTTLQDGQLVTNGGRVMAVSAIGPTLSAALQRVYDGIAHIHFEGMHYRRDIGRTA